MARTRLRAGGITFEVEVDDRATREALRDIRREIGRTVIRPTLLDVARREVVPTARRLGPSIVRTSLIARATTTGAALTTDARGMRRRIVGILEFGGTIRGQIYPRERGRGAGRRRPAIPLQIGGRTIYRAWVRRPRVIRPKAFMRRAVAQEVASFERALAREVPAAMQRRLDGISQRRL